MKPIEANLSLGLDIGSVSIAAVLMNQDHEVIRHSYFFHQGDIKEILTVKLADWPWVEIDTVISTRSVPGTIKSDARIDNYVALIEGVKQSYPQIGSILNIGGEKFNLIRFDENGNYQSNHKNTSCAAGTGSFLDQQANRLGMETIAEFSERANHNENKIPMIASRCAVFAKTDLIHAQQEGYTIDEISDGLCLGLAKNIVDVLFKNSALQTPLIVSGGVSKNQAVITHIEKLLQTNVIRDKNSHLFAAIGAVLAAKKEKQQANSQNNGRSNRQLSSVTDLFNAKSEIEKKYHYEPLELKLSRYPDFSSWQSYLSPSRSGQKSQNVEVDIYMPLNQGNQLTAYLGIDIGSTSTKAVLLDMDSEVVAGFYTRTAGNPLAAVKEIFFTIEKLIEKYRLNFHLNGVGSTGSGRKFIGQIIGADLMMDEITAHARAAYEIHPEVDTIIEIGGQDAKFTTMKNGVVTFSIMNNVCAAGTGSFIEEQANKLNCSLYDYAGRANGQRAPLASDRCTVFMERDINHLIQDGYEVNEALAAVLHSVRENYLSKVAVESNIGDVILFQGATAKNRALVAAFEQRLGKEIIVSKFCHLTGALGTALLLREEHKGESSFRGLSLYEKEIPISSEICTLCTNHCKISIADIDGQRVAYGFMCGRDLETERFINKNKSGFDLLKERHRIFQVEENTKKRSELTIGIPSSLYLTEHMPFWKLFFERLGIKTMTSKNLKDAVHKGKTLAGSEFCAPMNAFHGHVAEVASKSDYLFLPYYLDEKKKNQKERRQYCYYTQFSPALASLLNLPQSPNEILMPIIKYLYSSFHTKKELYKHLKSIKELNVDFWEISEAFDYAEAEVEKRRTAWKERFAELNNDEEMAIVFLGRPYTILDRTMNKGIPEIFAGHGIKTYYQDMLSYDKKDISRIEDLLTELHWHFASKVMESTEYIATQKNLYPVLISSFMCSPDSFIMEYFKELMDFHEKPYLILQLDDHDSNVGYETRIEAAIRSFRNHFQKSQDGHKITRQYFIPKKANEFAGKTILLPNWDTIPNRLIVANLERFGIDARLLEEDETSIQKSLRHNSGQCIPLNIVAEEFIDYIDKHKLDPAQTILWMIDSPMACNIKLYPYQIKKIADRYGKNMEGAKVFGGELTFIEISLKAAINTYLAYMFGGLLKKAAAHYRPYEVIPGSTNRVIEESIFLLEESFRKGKQFKVALAKISSMFQSMERRKEIRPKVAIFGDIYARDNDILNQDLIRFVEDNGGEVVTTPFHYFAKMVASQYLQKWIKENKYIDVITSKALLAITSRLEKRYYKYFADILEEPIHEYKDTPRDILAQYNVPIENTGESIDNLLKVHYLAKQYPDLSLFIQASPAFCCAALITEAMSKKIEEITGVPVVSLSYDGTGGDKNEAIIPYLKYPRKKKTEQKAQKKNFVS